VKKTTAPFGLWPSPIAAVDLTRGARGFGHRHVHDGWLYWTETRPDEKGRQVLMRGRPGGAVEELLAAPFSARSRVHEYGGGEFGVCDGVVYFVNDADQDLWSLVPGGAPQRLTQEAAMRFASPTLDSIRGRLIAVAEIHDAKGGHGHPENCLVAIPLDGAERGKPETLVRGRDFYAFAAVSPDGSSLAYLAWDLPDMPWDQAGLYVAPVRADGSIGRARRIAGGDGVAAMQPAWLADGRLVFLHDASDWGNVALWDGRTVRDLTRLKTDLGMPMWNLGTRSLVVGGPDRLLAAASIDGKPAIVEVSDLVARRPQVTISDLGTGIAGVGSLAPLGDGVCASVARDAQPTALAFVGKRRKAPTILRTSSDMALDAAGVSVGRQVAFRGAGGRQTWARYYAPASATHRAPRNQLPPALVLAHGGPTSSAARGLGLRIQYYTSRGFAVLDVDYAGSTGYGHTYRERLDGAWGLADVADCVAAATWAGREGLVDAARIAIAGGSAGGYTVLMALATTQGVFAAGSSHYGISDLTLLMRHTHKFEAGYLHRLLGTTARNWRRVCRERSPLMHSDRIRAPLILFQGLDDKVVPPEQSRLIAEKVRAAGVAVELHEFAGEAHGFRRADTIIAVLEAELAFLRAALPVM
jgi:dipeptidyl aminopeptidase/acylaminoacyl peptidase